MVPPDDLPRLIDAAVPDGRRGEVALATEAGRLDYTALLRAVATGAAAVEAVTEPGDRVVVQLPNSVELITVNLAVMAARRVVVALSADAGVERTRMALETTRPTLMIALRAPDDVQLRCPLARPVLDTGKGLRLEPVGDTDPTPSIAPGTGLDAGMVLFSSGSTGEPKGVVLRHAGLVWTARTLAGLFGFGADHRELILCPLVHSGAWQRAAATLAVGGRVHIADGSASIAGLFEDVAEHGITGFYTPPPLIRYLLKIEADRARRALATVRTIEIGSAPVTGDEVRALLELLPDVRVFVHYGLTECSRATVLDARAQPDKLATVGCAVPDGEVAVRDAEGRPCGAGDAGEVWVRGPQIAAGYWNDADATAARFADGWVHTGDQGRLDADGFLTFAGRSDDRIDHAGFHFFPGEVEAALGAVPGVADYLVVGVPDPRGMLGELPCAFVVPADPAKWTPVTFGTLARRRLPPYMVPRKIVPVPELPRTAAGKSDRRRAVELYGDAIAKAKE